MKKIEYSYTKLGEHSPTPWRAKYENYWSGYVISIPHTDPKKSGGRGIGVAMCGHPIDCHHVDLPNGCAGECPHNKENARFIVLSVNCHDRLLKEVKRTHKLLTNHDALKPDDCDICDLMKEADGY